MFEGGQYYSQTYEDYILGYVFEEREAGVYVDVGANHPSHFSVTKLFYERGWRGVNIDANPQFRRLYETERPGDINLFIGIAEREATLTLFKLSDAKGVKSFRVSGLSTFDPEIAKKHVKDGFLLRKVDVPVRRLDDVLPEHGIAGVDFLNVDVEGFEKNVLLSVDFGVMRPKVVIVEATYPRTLVPVFDQWESILFENGYEFALSDGLNRYYVHPDHRDLLPRFDTIGECVAYSKLQRGP